MKKQNLLTLLSIFLIFTPLNTTTKALESNQDNIILAKSISDPLIVLKGKSVTCGSKLDRLLALEYLNEKRTRPNFDDISISVRINGKTAELIQGAQLDLTKYDGETIAIDYKYEGKVVKTLNLKVDCGNTGTTGSTLELIGKAKDGVIIITANAFKTLDLLQFIDVKALGGPENIEIKILDVLSREQYYLAAKDIRENGEKIVGITPNEIREIGSANPSNLFKVIYTLKNNPGITGELIICPF